MIQKFKNKPVIIEAVQFTGGNGHELVKWSSYGFRLYVNSAKTIKIPTLEGTMTAQVGDWIIKGKKGEFYPCKPDIFEQTYEKVSDQEFQVDNVIPKKGDTIVYQYVYQYVDYRNHGKRFGYPTTIHQSYVQEIIDTSIGKVLNLEVSENPKEKLVLLDTIKIIYVY